MTSTNRNSPPLTVVTTNPGSTQRQRTRPPQSACPQLWTAPPADPAQYATTIMASSNTSMSRPVLTNYKSTPAPSVAVSIHQSQQLQQQQLNSVVQEEEGEINPPVDAALLSALRDPRERVALLRLEQKLVEFANDPTLTQVEVGPGNGDSVVNNLAPTSSTSSGTAEVEPNSGTSTSNAINRELQNMNLRTSFHRKCLHKLADRFRISRETTENNAIRLMKGVDSRVPNKLLIDLPIENGCMSNGRSIHTNQPNAQTGTVNGIIPISGGPVAPNGIVSSSHAPQDRIGESNNSIIPITDGLSSIQLSSHGGGGGKKSRKKEKIKIFKRSMAQKGSSGNLSMKDGSNGDMNGSNSNRRKKNLGDKEKAYAEARARIFNSSSENSTNKSNSAAQVNNTDDLSYDRGHSDHTTPHTAAVAVPNYQDTNGTFITTGDRKCPPHSAALGEFYTASPQTFSPVSDAPPPYSSSSVTTSTTATSATPSSASLHFCTLANAISTEPASASSANGPTTKNRASNSAPAAVTSGAASKVTWRNRQQEASDPDFQRGVHVVGGLGVPMTAVAPSAAPYHYHSNHHQHPTSSAHQCGVMPSVGAGMVHNLINGYHYPTLGVGGVGAVPGNTGSGGGVLDLSAYHHGEPASSWQRQDDGIGCGVTATAVHQSQQIPPVIFSSPTPSAHHGQYQVLSQQHQYTSSIGLPLSGSSADGGSMSITTNQQRHGTDPLLGDPSGSSSRTRLVYTAEDFPALG
mmetsp:Transcript_12860/g.15083  ORF Transcript_12860/g.15083 Transcript_12860/m.15083 type:complete len:745 (+) Transcript_12860:200-2434(+)